MAKGWKLSTEQLIMHFLDKAKPVGGCWLWEGHIDRFGYGMYKWVDRSNEKAHRLMYMLAYGPIPEGMCICHRCDVRNCVNPDHLFLGTRNDNIQDMVQKNRHSTGRGEASGMAKLTEPDIKAIRTRYAKGRISQTELGRMFGVCHSTVGRIVRKQGWSHVEG